jgi:hypothetical protein
MSGLEIALEEVQDHVLQCLCPAARVNGSRVSTLPWLVRPGTSSCARHVEEERYL